MAVVSANEKLGVFVGTCMGFAFWTKLDSVGQDVATTFPNEGKATDFLNSWPEGAAPDTCRFVEVGEREFVTIAELKAVGLGHLLGEMEADALRYAEPVGTA